MTAHARGPSLGSRSPTTGPRLDVESQRGSRGQPPAVLLSPEHGGLYLRRRRRPAAAGSPRSTSRRPPRPCHDTAVCRARRLQSGQREPAARRGPHTVRLPGSAGPGPESALGADGQAGRAPPAQSPLQPSQHPSPPAETPGAAPSVASAGQPAGRSESRAGLSQAELPQGTACLGPGPAGPRPLRQPPPPTLWVSTPDAPNPRPCYLPGRLTLGHCRPVIPLPPREEPPTPLGEGSEGSWGSLPCPLPQASESTVTVHRPHRW